MARMRAVYYRDATGIEPVDVFIDGLDARSQVEIDWHVELLNGQDERDPPLAFPYSSQVQGELRELRCHHGRRLYRILYRRSERLYVLLHAFEKRTSRVPPSDVRVAERRWDDFKARMGAEPRRGLRAAGHDAP